MVIIISHYWAWSHGHGITNHLSSFLHMCPHRGLFMRNASWAKYIWRSLSLSRSNQHPPTWRLTLIADMLISSSCPTTGWGHRVAAPLITSSATSICLGRYSFTCSEAWAKYTWRRSSLSSRHPLTWRLAWVTDTWPLILSWERLRPGCWL